MKEDTIRAKRIVWNMKTKKEEGRAVGMRVHRQKRDGVLKCVTRLAAAGTALLVLAGTAAMPAWGASAQAARSTVERDSQSMHSVWLLPDSDTYYISESDVSWMDDNELMLARNEFYARRGRKFATRSIREYFNRQAWYRGYIEPEDFSTDLFNRYEQANVDFIVTYENRRSQIRMQQMEGPKQQNGLDGDNPTAEKEAHADRYGELYEDITDRYQDALAEGWSGEACEIAGISGRTADLEKPEELGFGYRDLDGDGTGELLIGPMDTQAYGQGAVFEIYTVQDGTPVEIASGDENTSYYICEDNTICRELKQADGNWELDYMKLEGGQLVYKDVLLLDESLNAEEPWFVIGDAEGFEQDADGSLAGVTAEDYDAISYEDASELRASHAADSLELVPFGEE